MKIGVPKEIKNHEYRVGMTPAAIREVVTRGHEVWVETQAGAGIGMDDSVYTAAGARIAANAADVFERAELIVKVKEPQAAERARLRPHHTLFTYLHLAPDAQQTHELIKSGATCIAYETVTSATGGLPLLSGVPGVEAGKVVILGGGVVGTNAATVAVGLGAQVTVIDKSVEALRRISAQFGGRVQTVYSTQHAIETHLRDADLVIGGVLIPGAAAPKLITRAMLGLMRKGAVIVDVAIDQGGCCETSHPTTHADPVYIVEGVVHYCVANMPGGVPRTSTFALNNVTLPFILQLADRGPVAAMRADPNLLAGLNVARGMVTNHGVADALGLAYHDPHTVLAHLPAAA
ncbi:alanine dehydrogenase [Pandoraea sp. CB10b_02]|uniref:alanine dehydrogenase n=1 Tax=Pandoraea sp. CB10b_02 TaxID=2014535 RepID=UPI00257DF173|nr:alanine dehydrogenase [Pandoraea sp. CB10b_02]